MKVKSNSLSFMKNGNYITVHKDDMDVKNVNSSKKTVGSDCCYSFEDKLWYLDYHDNGTSIAPTFFNEANWELIDKCREILKNGIEI